MENILESWRTSFKSLANLRGNPERYFIILTLSLITFGVLMLYSTSFIVAQEKFHDGLMLVKRQLTAVGLGLVGMYLMSRVPIKKLDSWLVPLAILAALSLIIVRIPGLGIKAGGAWRWIRLGPLQIQPAEFVKFLIILLVAFNFACKGPVLSFTSWLRRMLIPGVLLGMVYLQPDFGTIVLTSACVLLVLFATSCPLKYVVAIGAMAIPIATLMIWAEPYRRARVLAYLNPWGNPEGSGFQLIQSFVALRNGGLLGVGLGNSQEKLHFLPAAHNDFVLSIIAEELGFVGFVGILTVFLLLGYLGIRVAINARDIFARGIAIGITGMIVLQGFFNAGVVLGVLPTKGITLPFISYGGSSIIAMLVATGVLWRIGKESHGET